MESLVTSVLPALHATYVPDDVPSEPFMLSLRIEGSGGWTAQIRGRHMQVERGEADCPTLWLFTTTPTVERFLEDAASEGRFLPKSLPPAGSVCVLTDPRLIKRIALANGRMELALRDAGGERLAVFLGFGDSARRPPGAVRADVAIEATLPALERILGGALPPDEALLAGHVEVRGNRLMAIQLALAVAPLYVRKTQT